MEDSFRIRHVYNWRWLIRPQIVEHDFQYLDDDIDYDIGNLKIQRHRKTIKFGKAKFVFTSSYGWLATAVENGTNRRVILAGSGWTSGNYFYAYELHPSKGTIPYGWV